MKLRRKRNKMTDKIANDTPFGDVTDPSGDDYATPPPSPVDPDATVTNADLDTKLGDYVTKSDLDAALKALSDAGVTVTPVEDAPATFASATGHNDGPATDDTATEA